ncbi:MAG: hypothetical protein R3178_11155, partial [Rhodothermales bacterium]|nr:hypothetical protein [Rhodothermales bacterium]
SWYAYGDTKVGQGREAAKQWLRDNASQHDEVKLLVKEKLGMITLDEPVDLGKVTNGSVAEVN